MLSQQWKKQKKSKANNQNHKNVASFTELTSNVSMLHFCRFLCCCMPSYIYNLICEILNHSKLKLKNHKVCLFECFVKHSQGIIFWFFQPHTSTQMINELNYTKQTHTHKTLVFFFWLLLVFFLLFNQLSNGFWPSPKTSTINHSTPTHLVSSKHKTTKLYFHSTWLLEHYVHFNFSAQTKLLSF